MAYLKPQSPLQHKDGDYFYPLTTVDQVILGDGTRLNTRLEDIENFDPSSLAYVGEENTLFSDKDKTLPIFPRTKTSAITNDEGIALDILLENAGIVPTPTAEDNGKFLQVVDGVATWMVVEDAEGVEV